MAAETIEPRFEVRQLIHDAIQLCWKKAHQGIKLDVDGRKFTLAPGELSNNAASWAMLAFTLESDTDHDLAQHLANIYIVFHVQVVGGERRVLVRSYYEVGRLSLGAIAVAKRDTKDLVDVTPQLSPEVLAVRALTQLVHRMRSDIHTLIDPVAALRGAK